MKQLLITVLILITVNAKALDACEEYDFDIVTSCDYNNDICTIIDKETNKKTDCTDYLNFLSDNKDNFI